MNKIEALTAMDSALKIRKYSWNTVRNYLFMADRFLTYSKLVGSGFSPEEYVNKFTILLDKQDKNPTTINLYRAAIKFLFHHVIHKPLNMDVSPNMKTAKTLPDVFSIEQMRNIIAVTTNPKQKLYLEMVYGCGLRCGESIRIRVGDLKRDRGLLYLRGKGNRDRIVSIADIPAHLIDECSHGKKAEDWLFDSQQRDYHISKRAASFYLEHACKKAKVEGKHNLHKLRHSFSVHLLEGGTDISFIQKILGHKDIRTTLIYARATDEYIGKIRSPLAKVV